MAGSIFIFFVELKSLNLFLTCSSITVEYYDVGSGEARTFEDVLNILSIEFKYHDEDKVPVGYQFYTKSNKNKWMNGWEPKFNLELGLNDYKEKIS